MVYPFDKNHPDGPLRNLQNYADDCELTTEDFDSHGVKSKSILSQLSFYQPIIKTNIDYMHSIHEGVVKRFFKVWFEDKDDDNNRSL